MRSSQRIRCIALAALAMLTQHAAIAADGDLDLTFGDAGIALAGIIDGSGGVSNCGPVVQADGRILICTTRAENGSSGSDLFVARFTAEGELDPDFSFDGKVTIDFDGGTGFDSAFGLAVQADGRIVVVGATSPDGSTGSSDFAIARLTASGELDASFGGGTGKRTVAFDLAGGSGDDGASDVAITSNGRILVAGNVQRSTGTDFGVARLLQDGTLDSAFNLTGKVTVAFDLADSTDDVDQLLRMVLDADGRILLGGSADNGPAGHDFALARLMPNGQSDSNFDADGRTTLAFDLGGSNVDQMAGMTLQRDGRIVAIGVAAQAGAAGSSDFAVARFQPDGSPDEGFGVDGRTLVPFDLVQDGGDTGLSVVELSNGRLLLAGGALNNVVTNGLSAVLARLMPDGSLDLSFGTQGKRSYDLGLSTTNTQAFLDFAWQGSRLLASGIGVVDDPSPFPVDSFVVRFENDLLFADGFQ
jgi:uncharacterized delta-60 repeat protein